MGQITPKPFKRMNKETGRWELITPKEIEYLNEGKGCAVWLMILVVIVLIGAGIFVYSTWEKN